MIGKQIVSTILTVDNFSGAAFWHVSAQVLKDGKPVNLFVKLDRSEAKEIADYLKNLLSDVGRGEIRQNNSISEFNYHKLLTDLEAAKFDN